MANNNYYLLLFLAFLATYRLAWEFATKDGLFGWFLAFRTWVIIESKKAWIEDYITCAICWSLWVAPVVLGVLMPPMSWREFLLSWFAVSGAVMVVHLSFIYRK